MLKSPALQISLIYALFGSIWIWKSDQLVAAFVTDVDQFSTLSMYKGWGFVVITAILVYLLAWRQFNRLLGLQKQLKQKEAEFRLYIEKLPVGAFRTLAKEDGRFVLVNQAMVTLTGCASEAELLHRKIYDFYEHPEDREHLIHQLKLRHKVTSEHIRFKRIDGTLLDLSITASLHRDEAGKHYIDGIAIDETVRRQAELELRLLWRALNQTTEAVILTDNHYKITYVNPAFELTTLYPRDEMLKKSIGLLRSGKHEDDFYRNIQETIESGETWHGQLIGRRKNGTLYEEEVTASPVLDTNNVITHYVFIGRDISHEAQLNRQLRQAQKMEAIGRMAGGIAHDFNNILTAILGFADLAQQDLTPDNAVHKDLDEILRASRRAKDIVKRILTFSRQSQHQPSLTDGAKIIEEVMVLLQSAIPPNVKIHTDIDPACPTIMIDATEFHQVVMNLSTNAHQAMQKNGGDLYIGLHPYHGLDAIPANPRAPLTECVRLSVRDTGEGIDADTLQKIFDPYFTTKSIGEGTGLGLATVHAIIENCGGVVLVDSTVGHGTEFQIYIPIATVNENKEPPEEQPVSGQDRHILLIDDEPAVLNVMRRQLERAKYRVSAFTDAAEAIACLANRVNDYCAIVTDHTMPNISGIELTTHCRKLRPDIPVLMITGHGNLTVREGAQKAGIDRVLTKPLTSHELCQAVDEVLYEAQATQKRD